MRDIDTTIEQAIRLGSKKRITLSEIESLRSRTIREYGKVDVAKLILDAYDFGFTLGYRSGRRDEKKAGANTPAE